MLTRNITQILVLLRSLMLTANQNEKLTAYVVPSGDPHHSEYVDECHHRRGYITGFDGSAGTAVVTADKALLWTDSRYFIQAEHQLEGTEWILMKTGEKNVPTLNSWLATNLISGDTIGIDPWVYPKTEWDTMDRELRSQNISLIPIDANLVDRVWDKERPECTNKPIFQLPLKFAGKDASDKMKDVRKDMKNKQADVLVVSELDEVAWLLNLRGEDIMYNPVFFSFVIVTMSTFELFVDPVKLNPGIVQTIQGDGGTIYLYEEVIDRLEFHMNLTKGKVWMSRFCNYMIVSKVDPTRQFLRLTPIAFLKAIKNDVEVEGMMSAQLRDSAAFVEFLAWLENKMENGVSVTEITAAKQLESFRRSKEHYMGLSYPPISACGAHAALPHYIPTKKTDMPLSTTEVYLIDSGGQYLDGTIDTTRTVYFGEPSQELMDAFTRVLKGSIFLRTATFPRKSVGSVLDTLARKYLWDAHLNYGHGTGHGIGSFLGVHEGPFSIGYKTGWDDPGLEENMFTTNEPGFYKEGHFGVRIESVIRIVNATPGGEFLTFEDATLIPIQLKLINKNMLTSSEVLFLNQYHTKVRDKVGAYIKSRGTSDFVFKWLEEATRPIVAENDVKRP